MLPACDSCDYDNTLGASAWLAWGVFFDPGTQTNLLPDDSSIWHKAAAAVFSVFGYIFNVALLGEIVGNKEAAEMGYRLIDNWLQYEQTADLHEFTSPTYYWVQINSLYMGYLYARRPGAKAVFKAATKTNLATVLRVASHRIEIKDISAATRRSKGIKVSCA